MERHLRTRTELPPHTNLSIVYSLGPDKILELRSRILECEFHMFNQWWGRRSGVGVNIEVRCNIRNLIEWGKKCWDPNQATSATK